MARKPSRSSIAKKAWKTRRANAKLKDIADTSKAMPLDKMADILFKPAAVPNLDKVAKRYAGENLSSLCSTLDDTISTLESRLTALNARLSAIL